jgi:hypothetical protein
VELEMVAEKAVETEVVETGVETPLETRVLEPETLLENERVA